MLFLDLSGKECPNGHSSTLQITGMNQELFEIACWECGWTGYDVDLIQKEENKDEPRPC